MTRLKLIVSLIILVEQAAIPAFGRDAPPVASAKLFDDMMKCRSVDGAADRLACYDKQVAVIGDAQARNEVAVIDKDSLRKTERQQFGLATPALPALDKSADNDKGELNEIRSTIVSFQPATRDKWRLRLADGSEWLTLETIAYRVPVANMGVTVKKAAFGSFLLRPDGWPAVRARRAK